MLSDVMQTEIQKVTMSLPLINLTSLWINDLYELTNESKGSAKLAFQIVDTENNITLNLNAREATVSPGKDLMAFIGNHPEVTLQVN